MNRNDHHYPRKKIRTNKIADRLSYVPNKHKQKARRKLKQELRSKAQVTPVVAPPISIIKFGSFNINGLDFESSWAVEELLKTRGFDVCIILISLKFIFKPSMALKVSNL